MASKTTHERPAMPTTEPAIPILELEYRSCEEYPSVHCPACGACVLHHEPERERPCKHLLFTYCDSVDEFYHLPRPAEALLDQAVSRWEEQETDEAPPCQFDLLLAAIPRTGTSFVLNVNTGGVGCGPFSETMRLVFELSRPEKG